MIKNLTTSEIIEIKNSLNQRYYSCYISKATGYLITYVDEEYDFKNIESATLIFYDKETEEDKLSVFKHDLNKIKDYDKIIMFVNLETELGNFKYTEIKSSKEVKKGFNFICEWCKKIVSTVNKDIETLVIDFDKIQTSLLLIKYEKL